MVLILNIFEYLRGQDHIWLEINLKKYPSKFQVYLNFNLCRTTMQVSHLNNMAFLALNDQFFIPDKVMVQKILNSVNFILIIVGNSSELLHIFSYYNFGVTAR